MKSFGVICSGVGFILLAVVADGASQTTAESSKNPYSAWKHGIPADADFFPIAVWLQDPAQRRDGTRRAGINLYVGLWQGPTEEQLGRTRRSRHAGDLRAERGRPQAQGRPDHRRLDARRRARQRPVARAEGRGTVRRSRRRRSSRIIARSARPIPTRPVMLNLGQGVAWDDWYGRGVRRNHPEDYPEYLKGCDIVSFDIYPACHENKAIAGKLWYRGRRGRSAAAMDRRPQGWSGTASRCTRINNPDRQGHAQQVRAEVWMSLIHGSRGLIYFVHQFKPKFIEAGLLADEEMRPR